MYWFMFVDGCKYRGEDASSSGNAQMKLSVAYSSEENRLVITIHACR